MTDQRDGRHYLPLAFVDAPRHLLPKPVQEAMQTHRHAVHALFSAQEALRTAQDALSAAHEAVWKLYTETTKKEGSK